MKTMNTNRFFFCALLACVTCFAPCVSAQTPVKSAYKSALTGRTYSGEAFEAFTAKEGWVFTADQTKSAGFPNLDGAASAIEGGTPFSAAAFDPATFDPRLYLFERVADPTLPTNYNVGDRGVIQFHSPQRCQDLYARHLAGQSKEK